MLVHSFGLSPFLLFVSGQTHAVVAAGAGLLPDIRQGGPWGRVGTG